jgi:hypothetical protein
VCVCVCVCVCVRVRVKPCVRASACVCVCIAQSSPKNSPKFAVNGTHIKCPPVTISSVIWVLKGLLQSRFATDNLRKVARALVQLVQQPKHRRCPQSQRVLSRIDNIPSCTQPSHFERCSVKLNVTVNIKIPGAVTSGEETSKPMSLPTSVQTR